MVRSRAPVASNTALALDFESIFLAPARKIVSQQNLARIGSRMKQP
jgi:hypothetical protein